jgi:type IV secretory pathway VirB3-like protein
MRTCRPAAKAINKPLLIAGVDMRLAGLALVITTVIGAINDGVLYKLVMAALFVVICFGARVASRKDPNLLSVWNEVRRHRWLYDPGKRADFRVLLVRDQAEE